MNLEGRIATDVDIAELAAMNQQLIRDEGHRNLLSADELEDRMRKWLGGEYNAAIFTVNGSTVGYAMSGCNIRGSNRNSHNSTAIAVDMSSHRTCNPK